MLENYFATEINGTDATGIVNIKTKEVMCICTKEKAKLILPLLNNTENAVIDGEEFCGKCGTKKK